MLVDWSTFFFQPHPLKSCLTLGAKLERIHPCLSYNANCHPEKCTLRKAANSSFWWKGWKWKTGRQPGQETAQVCKSQRKALKPILRHFQHFQCHPFCTLKAISTVPPILISFSKSFKIVLSAHYHKELKVTVLS